MTKYCNTNTNKETADLRAFYRRLCDSPQGADIPLFAQAWWLDAACPEAWTVLTASALTARSGTETSRVSPVAAMPIHTPYGNTVRMALFTQNTSIYLPSGNQAKEQKTLEELADALSRYRYVQVQFPPEQRQAQPFYWHGFDLRVRYTYRLERLRTWREQGGPESIENALLDGMSRGRQRLRLAERQALQVKTCTTAEMTELYRAIFARQGIRKKSHETACLERLIETTLQRRQGGLWGCYDADGRLQSAAFIAWQGRTAYYVAGGSRKKNPHAQTLVLYQAIASCAAFCDVFDFEGSMIKGIAQFFRGFGAVPCPYIVLSGRKPDLLTRAWRKLGRLSLEI